MLINGFADLPTLRLALPMVWLRTALRLRCDTTVNRFRETWSREASKAIQATEGEAEADPGEWGTAGMIGFELACQMFRAMVMGGLSESAARMALHMMKEHPLDELTEERICELLQLASERYSIEGWLQ
jgi:hypothetical protein